MNHIQILAKLPNIMNFLKPLFWYRCIFLGVYVLQDNSFRFLNRVSGDRQYLEASPKVTFQLAFIKNDFVKKKTLNFCLDYL